MRAGDVRHCAAAAGTHTHTRRPPPSAAAEISRYASILFLVVQCVVIIDMAYSLHDWWMRRIAARAKEMDDAGWQPGACSNCWAVSYLVVAVGLWLASVVSLGVLFKYFGACGLAQFFLAFTLIAGLALTVVSLWGASKGVLVPSVLFAYNTYLVYGAVSNNPDGACNLFAATENKNQASILTGLAIAVVSITYAAYSSANSFHGAVVAAARHTEAKKAAATAAAATSPIVTATAPAAPPAAAGGEVELGAAGKRAPAPTGAPKGVGTPAAYADDAPASSASSASSTGSGSALAGAPAAAAAAPDAVEPHPWLFHLIMMLGGLYLAMLLTNWGEPTASATGNPELSQASMWVRIVSQWLIWLLYIWSLIAPSCCPGRDFD